MRIFSLCVLLLVALSFTAVEAQTPRLFDEGKPFDLPVALPPGPSTWLLGQAYGNTTGAYANATRWYEAGQGLHFGIDISMPCGTPLVAVADAEVMEVDNFVFGSGPHNLILRHNAYGMTTLYGHLLERPNLVQGQFVQRGQEIATSGTPDAECTSRPHLHFEVRSLDYRTAFNPVLYINAAWNSLSAIGSFSNQSFERDLDNARQWMTAFTQPDVVFAGRLLNQYPAPWPGGDAPPTNPALMRTLGPMPATETWSLSHIGYADCCFWPWWDPLDPNVLYSIDGLASQRANVYRWQMAGEAPIIEPVGSAPPAWTSPDGTHTMRRENEQVFIRRAADGAEWALDTGGRLPGINTDNRLIMWLARQGESVPGSEPPPTEIWIANIDGQNARVVALQDGGSATWLDADRLLLSSSEALITTLNIFDTRDNSLTTLGSWERIRGLSVAPGGGYVMFYAAFRADGTNGVYALPTVAGAQPLLLPWFGGWRWRDATSVFYLPFDPTTNTHTLTYYSLETGENRVLTDPQRQVFSVANGDWAVSADGRRIAFLNGNDLTTWLLQAG